MTAPTGHPGPRLPSVAYRPQEYSTRRSAKDIFSTSRIAAGRYCVVVASGITARNAVVTIGQGGVAIAADVGFATAGCTNGIEVRTYTGEGTFTDNDFNININ